MKKKLFSIRNKLIIVFGILSFFILFIPGLLAVRIAQNAVSEKIENHLLDKAADTAEIIDGRISVLFQCLEGLTRMPVFHDEQATPLQKMQQLKKEADRNPNILNIYFADKNGKGYFLDGSSQQCNHYDWFKASIKGHRFCSEPYFDPAIDNAFVSTVSVPIYDYDNNIAGVILADLDGRKNRNDYCS